MTKILAVHGKAQSGKGTTVSKVIEIYKSHGKTGVEVNFADKLKDVVSDLFRIPRELMETTEGKKTHIEQFDLTVREILQKFGTDLARTIYEDIWVWNLQQTINDLRDSVDIICVSDMRFPNEYEIMKNEGACLLKTIRPNFVIEQHSHASETALDHITQWHSVCMSPTVEGVEENAEKLAKLLLNDVELLLNEY